MTVEHIKINDGIPAYVTDMQIYNAKKAKENQLSLTKFSLCGRSDEIKCNYNVQFKSVSLREPELKLFTTSPQTRHYKEHEWYTNVAAYDSWVLQIPVLGRLPHAGCLLEVTYLHYYLEACWKLDPEDVKPLSLQPNTTGSTFEWKSCNR